MPLSIPLPVNRYFYLPALGASSQNLQEFKRLMPFSCDITSDSCPQSHRLVYSPGDSSVILGNGRQMTPVGFSNLVSWQLPSGFSVTKGNVIRLLLTSFRKSVEYSDNSLFPSQLDTSEDAAVLNAREVSYALNSGGNNRRLLQSESGPRDSRPHCHTADDCVCENAQNWHHDECNTCVFGRNTDQNQDLYCSGMGNFNTPDILTFTFYARAPANFIVTQDSIVVAKLKNTRPYEEIMVQDTAKAIGGVKYEHLVIRGVVKPTCYGCFEATCTPPLFFADCAVQWLSQLGNVCNCEDSHKVFLFTVPVWAYAAEVSATGDQNALPVNFEFDIADQLFVTRSTANMAKRSPSDHEDLTLSYNITEKRFSIQCPLASDSVFFGNEICPFEGEEDAVLKLQTTSIDLPIHPQNALPYHTFTTNDQNTLLLTYRIQRVKAVKTFLYVHRVQFQTCGFPGVFTTYGITRKSCNVTQNPEANCATPYKSGAAPVSQNDMMTIRLYTEDAGSRTEVYNRTRGIQGDSHEFVLDHDEDVLEIVIQLDRFECVQDPNVLEFQITTERRIVDRMQEIQTPYCPTEPSCICSVSKTSTDSSAAHSKEVQWPKDECNNCVNTNSQIVCNGMGKHWSNTVHSFWFYAQPPPGIQLTDLSVGVLKLKNSVPFAMEGAGGVEFEHLSIRGTSFPMCIGCMKTECSGYNCTEVYWPNNSSALQKETECVQCERKVFIYKISVKAYQAEITEPPLTVSFEFEIDGKIYVTRSTEKLPSNSATFNHNARETLSEWPSRKYNLEQKLFQIVCPRFTGNVIQNDTDSCPFEGQTPAHIKIHSEISTATAVSPNSPVFSRAGPQMSSFRYTIRAMPGIRTFVTLSKAHFQSCRQDEFYETISQDGFLHSCSPSAQDIPDDLEDVLTNVVYKSSFTYENEVVDVISCPQDNDIPGIDQTDFLNIRHYVNNVGYENSTYDRKKPYPPTEPGKIWILESAGDRMEIEFSSDQYECLNDNNQILLHIYTENSPDTLNPITNAATTVLATSSSSTTPAPTTVLATSSSSTTPAPTTVLLTSSSSTTPAPSTVLLTSPSSTTPAPSTVLPTSSSSTTLAPAFTTTGPEGDISNKFYYVKFV